ncbi:MAG: hypothetical protein ALECFALPRED_010873 [Alectoria fallacina]|uniref:Fucose-specific lectin n=1 Tax=Alectoria fallacina TaxID=1903189 RepID=A0A8H3IFM3_9LECA|nr:MAG: hypothetical protein ALECFALPRED_010873 [Alectoria fallacina]
MADRHSTLELVEHDGRSTLELVRHDETARAPERDNDATAFELDASYLAPEALPGTAPQLHYRNSLPEVNSRIEKTTEQPTGRDAPKSLVRLIRIIVVLLVVAATAIGVGVGIWHTRRNRSSTISPPVAIPSVSNSPTPRAPTNISTAPTILNDTSLAAVILANGDRHLYFQDNTGTIRYAVRTASTSQWDTKPYLNISSSAKNNTPLAVTAIKPQGTEVIQLFYVSQSHHLNCSSVYSGQFNWINDDSLSNYSTASNTRSLSVTSIPQGLNSTAPVNGTADIALLFYVNTNGNVSALLNIARNDSISVDEDETVSSWRTEWIDISNLQSNMSNPYESSPVVPGSVPPFTSIEGMSVNFTVETIFAVGPALRSSPNTGYTAFYDAMYEPLQKSGREELLSAYPSQNDSDYNSIDQSDIAIINPNIGDGAFLIGINGTRPISLTPGPSPNTPGNEFPFGRLASVITPDNSITYLYHQINGTAFAEEQWDPSVPDWGSPTYITVLPS